MAFSRKRLLAPLFSDYRRMFPTLQLTAAAMDANRRYTISVEFACIDQKRYRYSFHQSKWIVAGPGERSLSPTSLNSRACARLFAGDVELPCRVHVHADSPATGTHWMKQTIAFERIKLTNNQLDQNGYVSFCRRLRAPGLSA